MQSCLRIPRRNGCPLWNAATIFRRGDWITFLCGIIINTCSIQKITTFCFDQFTILTLRIALYLIPQNDCNGALNSEHCGLRFTSTCRCLWSTCRDGVDWNMFARIGVRLFPRYKWPWLLFPSNSDWCNIQPNVRYVNYPLVIQRI